METHLSETVSASGKASQAGSQWADALSVLIPASHQEVQDPAGELTPGRARGPVPAQGRAKGSKKGSKVLPRSLNRRLALRLASRSLNLFP